MTVEVFVYIEAIKQGMRSAGKDTFIEREACFTQRDGRHGSMCACVMSMSIKKGGCVIHEEAPSISKHTHTHTQVLCFSLDSKVSIYLFLLSTWTHTHTRHVYTEKKKVYI